jgi:hypothetical protein
LILVSERVYHNLKRAIFESIALAGLWYAGTLMPNADSGDSSVIWDDSELNPDPWN